MSVKMSWILREAGESSGNHRTAGEWPTDLAPSFEALVEVLTRLVRGARPVQVSARQLHLLRTPAVLWMSDDTPALLLRATPGSATVQWPDATVSTLRGDALESRFSGRAIRLERPPRSGSGLVARLLRASLTTPGTLWATLALSGGATVCTIVAPKLTELLFDDALPTSASATLTTIAAVLLLVACMRGLCEWLSQRFYLQTESRLRHVGSRACFSSILGAPYTLLARDGVGGALERIHSADTAAKLLASGALQVVQLLLSSVYVVILFVRSPLLGLGATFVGTVGLVGATFFSRRHARLEQMVVSARSRSEGLLYVLLNGLESFRSRGTPQTPLQAWFRAHLGACTRELRSKRNQIALGAWVGATESTIIVGTLIWSVLAIRSGTSTVGALVGNEIIATALASSVAGAARVLSPAWALGMHASRANEVLGVSDAPARRTVPHEASVAKAVSANQVWFRYDDAAPWVLQDLSISVRNGEFRELSAPSGTGKSTLLRLLAGLLQPARGEVSVYGTPPHHYPPGEVFYLPQTATLFEGTIASNLRVYSGAPLQRLLWAADRTGLSRWLETLPLGLATPIASRGGNVSGGQRQLILLTAAVASQAPLVLLDEATRHLDPQTRRQIDLRALFPGRTVIHATHS